MQKELDKSGMEYGDVDVQLSSFRSLQLSDVTSGTRVKEKAALDPVTPSCWLSSGCWKCVRSLQSLSYGC